MITQPRGDGAAYETSQYNVIRTARLVGIPGLDRIRTRRPDGTQPQFRVTARHERDLRRATLTRGPRTRRCRRGPREQAHPCPILDHAPGTTRPAGLDQASECADGLRVRSRPQTCLRRRRHPCGRASLDRRTRGGRTGANRPAIEDLRPLRRWPRSVSGSRACGRRDVPALLRPLRGHDRMGPVGTGRGRTMAGRRWHYRVSRPADHRREPTSVRRQWSAARRGG